MVDHTTTILISLQHLHNLQTTPIVSSIFLLFLMLLSIALNNWKRARHGPRVQAKANSFIVNRIEFLETYSNLEGSKISLQPILRDYRNQATPDITELTLRRWWNNYKEWGELP